LQSIFLFFLPMTLIFFKEKLIHLQLFYVNPHYCLHFKNHLIILKFQVHLQFHHECHFLAVF
jgi:hypothetical protein